MSRVSVLVSGSWHRFFARKRLITLLELGLVIILAVALADLVVEIISNSTGYPGQAVPSPQVQQGQGDRGVSGGSPAPSARAKTLFGILSATATGPVQTDEELQETDLKLILRGVLVNTDSNIRLALIARPGNPEDVFKIGDTIEGAEIVRIEPKRVVIRRNGNMEALTLAIPKMKADLADRPVSSSGFARSGIRRISDNERVVSQQSLRQQLNNLPGLLQQARAVPHTVNGQPQGFKVVEIQAGSVFEDLGLQRNDVIQSVNGTPIRSTEDALQAYRDLRTSDSFQVGLLRSGRSMTLNLSVQ